MKKIKLQKGITLIALIITIVVLLILAVVTIGTIQKSKIITHAQNAASDYTIAQEKELIGIGYSEYLIEKSISKDVQLKVEGAQVTGSQENGWKVVFTETSSTYKVDKDGAITYLENGEEDVEIVISAEKDLAMIYYCYNTMYNENQPEIVSAEGYYDDENNDKISDINLSLGAYISNSYFNIPVSFFTENMPTEGSIDIIITHFDGTEQKTILTTTDNKLWTYQSEKNPIDPDNEGFEVRFRPYAIYGSTEYKKDYTDSTDYHLLDIDGSSSAVPFYKLNILGKIIEFPFNCQAQIACGDLANELPDPMYNNIENVSKIIVEFSNDTKKVYLRENIFNLDLYRSEDVAGTYTSENILLYGSGMFCLKTPESSLKTQIISIIVEESGAATKYNLVDSTLVTHSYMGT